MGQMTVEQWYGTIKTGLTKKLTENKEALPAGFNQQRFILNCITVIQDMMKDNKKKEQLEKINPETIPVCLAKAAYLGLDFFNGECYAIPYGGNLTFQTDYKGEIKLCKRYSKNKIKDIFAKVVRQGDFFMEEVDGGKQNVQYRPKPFSNEQMIGAFAIVVFEDGSMMYDTMSSEDIENVRNTYSKMKDSQAWKSSTGEMYKKTVLRRLCKLIDLDFDNIEQQKAYEDGGDVVFNQQSLPGATTGQALLPENDKPVDAFAAIKAQKQAEPVIDGMILEEA
ncbi:recombinase RecT [[Ruminococcus] torques]|jgi:recombinase, phage recT family|uniref:recombinase RecT n=1 Tax=[Ruminococcus] torques TaxID=33039 RepID=UPI003AB98A1B